MTVVTIRPSFSQRTLLLHGGMSGGNQLQELGVASELLLDLNEIKFKYLFKALQKEGFLSYFEELNRTIGAMRARWCFGFLAWAQPDRLRPRR